MGSQEVWHAYVRTERTAGQVAGARAVYKRCYNRSFEGDTADANMCTAWLQFEREAGGAADYASVAEKVESRLAELAVKTAEQASKLAAAAAAQAAKEKRDAAPVLTPTEIKRKRQEADPNFKPEGVCVCVCACLREACSLVGFSIPMPQSYGCEQLGTVTAVHLLKLKLSFPLNPNPKRLLTTLSPADLGLCARRGKGGEEAKGEEGEEGEKSADSGRGGAKGGSVGQGG
jgi:hypothetical protein